MTPLLVRTSEDVELYDRLARAEARESFWAYRRYIFPSMKIGWWQYLVSNALQQFYNDYRAGLRPKLAITSPPQHGKSRMVTEFISWIAGQDPNLKSIFASYSDSLGVRTNMELQRIITGDRYKNVFEKTKIGESNTVTMSTRWLRNSSFIEFVDHKGSFRNTTCPIGQVTGRELDFGFIDDPLKGRAEASSASMRDKVWNWLTDDYMTRFAENGALLVVMTRWHVDDPLGRLMVQHPTMRNIRYPAIAEEDEEYRRKGEALFPELKSRDFLLERKAERTQASWESLYQGNPIVTGGGIFPVDKFIIQQGFERGKIKKTIRYIDKAATDGGGAYTACVKMHSMQDGTFVVEDVQRGQWSSMERERRIKQMTEIDGYDTVTWVEQEPGSGGKESAESTIRMLAGFEVYADRVTGKKEVRAEPYAAQVQGGNVILLAQPWAREFMEEHEYFPNGKYKDQVDAAAGAFNKLTLGSTYPDDLNWVG